ncbi:MAG: DUF2520 domain-containing protein [Deltaproteobacteria bacterium]|nr:DUF2520 domain-containing protein [Deltaproteobacteria bacterium]
MNNLKVFVVGPGGMGSALVRRMVHCGVSVVGLHGRRLAATQAAVGNLDVPATAEAFPAALLLADVVVIATRDSDVAATAADLVFAGVGQAQTVLHLSGAWPARTALGGIANSVKAVGTMHPFFSAPSRGQVALPDGLSFGVQGDPAAVAVAQALVIAMGGHVLLLHAEAMSLYHAAACYCANSAVGLADGARKMLQAAGISNAEGTRALATLLHSVAENLERVGLPEALTGPVERGDVATVRRHLAAVAAVDPNLAASYRHHGQVILGVAREKNAQSRVLAPDALQQLSELFHVHTDPET